MKWRIRDLLNPVATRILLYGTNPFDLEYVLSRVDEIKKMSGKEIKNVWMSQWERKAEHYLGFAASSEESRNAVSAKEYYMLAAQCYYACYMVNTEDIVEKRRVYGRLAEYYKKSISMRTNKIEYIEIPMQGGKIPAYLHFPDNGEAGQYPCVMTYSGLGCCKEELDMLARPLNERGIAVLTVDIPGTGAALFDYDLKCESDKLDSAFDALYDYLDGREDIDSDRLANYGLCMGGGFAFRATSKHDKIKCCVSLFPLFLNFADVDSIPIWMKRGKWTIFQCGEHENYYKDMKVIEDGCISSDFLMVYSADDNWMNTDASAKLFERAKGYKEKLLVDEKPVYVSEETIMHAMPVGEQFHWVKHIASDFIAQRLRG